jgi:hypothetical protein
MPTALKQTMNRLICLLLGHEIAWVKPEQFGALPVLGCTRCRTCLDCAGSRSTPARAGQ